MSDAVLRRIRQRPELSLPILIMLACLAGVSGLLLLTLPEAGRNARRPRMSAGTYEPLIAQCARAADGVLIDRLRQRHSSAQLFLAVDTIECAPENIDLQSMLQPFIDHATSSGSRRSGTNTSGSTNQSQVQWMTGDGSVTVSAVVTSIPDSTAEAPADESAKARVEIKYQEQVYW